MGDVRLGVIPRVYLAYLGLGLGLRRLVLSVLTERIPRDPSMGGSSKHIGLPLKITQSPEPNFRVQGSGFRV